MRDAMRAIDALEARYSNFLKVGSNECEVILEFGQRYSTSPEHIHTRIITAPRYAEEFLDVLQRALMDQRRGSGPG
jgi:hypothetical protein